MNFSKSVNALSTIPEKLDLRSSSYDSAFYSDTQGTDEYQHRVDEQNFRYI